MTIMSLLLVLGFGVTGTVVVGSVVETVVVGTVVFEYNAIIGSDEMLNDIVHVAGFKV